MRAETPTASSTRRSAWRASTSAERTRVPAVLASLVPVSRSGAFPTVGAPELPLGRIYNRLTYTIGDQMAWQPFRRLVDRWRVEVLGLAPAPFLGPMRAVERLRRPVLYGFSPSIVPRPADWGSHVHVTGYWFNDPENGWRPPAELAHFLDAGPPPVYVGFGSMTDRDPAVVARIVLEALEQTGCRAVVLSGWARLPGVTDRPGVHFVENVPHDWLFPKMAAVVHHGGAGTTHAGLRAGAPTVVVPFFTDQPLAARHEREHQRTSTPVLPEGDRPLSPRPHRARGRRRRSQQQAAQDPRLEDPSRSTERTPIVGRTGRCCDHRLSPVWLPLSL